MVRVDELVLLSGQVAQDRQTGALIAGDVRAQTAQIFENIQNIQSTLRAVVCDLSHVVKATVYLTDMQAAC
jgi:2-iminobutanoate/2-iminopropanoate deaminase